MTAVRVARFDSRRTTGTMSRERIYTTTPLLLALLLAASCARETDQDQAELASPVGPVPAAEQRAGNPAAGYATLTNGGYDTCGIPYRAYRRMTKPEPTAQNLGREGRNAELPHMLSSYTTPDGVELVTTNCLGCHAAFFEGKLVIGLGNETLDFTADPTLNAERAGTFVRGAAETAAWQKWADRMAALAPYIVTETVGVNPAPNATVALMAHRDPETMAWSEEPLLAPPPRSPLPVSVPPWWRMKKKHAMFYHTAGRGDHARMMMMKSLVCTDTEEEARRIDAMFPDIRAYISSLEPPQFPFAINGKLAERGRTVFQGTARDVTAPMTRTSRIRTWWCPWRKFGGSIRPSMVKCHERPRHPVTLHLRWTAFGQPRLICTTVPCRPSQHC